MTRHAANAKPLDWHRFSGAFASIVRRNADGSFTAAKAEALEVDPTIGAAWHRCDCCGRDFLVIAAVAQDGNEVNVALPAATAADFVERAVDLIVLMDAAPSKDTVQ